ncbi:hypothetical protein SASPL_119127 [Salvia splendens]|uniref:PPM-type phosphatase domain-containing protein n=1 Tax=Salvia splendens TaxID=180675 RepID=A0A8X8XY02_SALSN|nr:hypothetical protein SASPL_119127 [Salvia splendens]
MLCNRVLSAVNLWAGHIRRQTEVARLRYICGGLNTTDLCPYLSNYKLGRKRTMMVDCGETARRPAVGALPEKGDDGGYASGGWSRTVIFVLLSCLTKLASLHGETYRKTDKDFLDSEKETFRDDGSTASTAVLVGNHLYVANVGDSRTIISKAGKAIPLSDDHKPNRSDERRRIENAGGVVMWAGLMIFHHTRLLCFSYNCSKKHCPLENGLGNFSGSWFKTRHLIILLLQDLEVDQDLELLVLASDGLWDVVPNEDAVSIAQAEEEPVAAARKLTETAFTRGSADNITCIVVKFQHEEAGPNQDTEAEVETQTTTSRTGESEPASKEEEPQKTQNC